MKKTLQKLLLSICLIAFINAAQAQTTVTAPGAGTWLGYMNVFDAAGSTYLWGSGWGVNDLKTTIGASTVTLQPNFNNYNATDPYWSNGPIGNKTLEALSYSESTALLNQTVTFNGNVLSNTLSSAYASTIFVKALDPALGYAAVVNQFITTPASGPFSVAAVIPNTPGLIVQWGFTVNGLNANPAAETSLGNIVIGPASPTPLSLINFEAAHNNSSVDLNWTTVDEVNVKEFEVQKSTDGSKFETFSTISAKNKLRNSYETIDMNVLHDTYYRLKMIDNDETFTYSQIQKVILPETANLIIYPNPATDAITISGVRMNALQGAKIYSINGSLMTKLKLTSPTLDISSYPIGVYYIKLQTGQQISFTKK